MGSDVVEDMRYYAEKATTLLRAVDYLVVFEREVSYVMPNVTVAQIHEKSRVLDVLHDITSWPLHRLQQFVIFRKVRPSSSMGKVTNCPAAWQ